MTGRLLARGRIPTGSGVASGSTASGDRGDESCCIGSRLYPAQGQHSGCAVLRFENHIFTLCGEMNILM